MSAYNVEPYIGESIRSIINQTFTDFEFIIIDDGSTDNTVDIIRSFNDQRIKLYINEENKGISYTRNRGFDLASGRYLAVMDSDDIAMPERLQKQVEFMEKHTDISILGTNYIRMDNNKEILHPLCNSQIKVTLLADTTFAHPSVMMRMSDILTHNIKYDVTLNSAIDYDFWTEAAIRGLKGANLPDILLKYRIRPTQISTVQNSDQRNNAKKIRVKYTLSLFGKNLFNDIDIDIIKNRFTQHSITDIISITYKLKRQNKKRNILSKKELNIFLWDKISLSFGKKDLINIIKNKQYNLSFKIWLFKNYVYKVLYNVTLL